MSGCVLGAVKLDCKKINFHLMWPLPVQVGIKTKTRFRFHSLHCYQVFYHYSTIRRPNREPGGILMACWSLLIFSTTCLRGEEKVWSCSLSKSTWTLDQKVRSMCAKLSSRQVCLCAWASQAPLAFLSGVTLYAALCVPTAVEQREERGNG